MKAWTFQDHRQKQKLGAKAPWSVGWVDPEGKRRSKRIGLKSSAEKYRRKVEGELAAGVYENKSRKSWIDFRAEFFNLFNRVNLNGVSSGWSSGSFGRVTSTFGARNIQFGLKIVF